MPGAACGPCARRCLSATRGKPGAVGQEGAGCPPVAAVTRCWVPRDPPGEGAAAVEAVKLGDGSVRAAC